MTDTPKRRGRPPKASYSTPEAKMAPVKRRRKNIVGTSMPYVAPVQAAVTPVALGYRPKKKQSRPLVQPNRV